MMEKSDLVLFDKKNTTDILNQFDFKIAKEGDNEVLIGTDKKPIQCPTCETNLSIKKVGTIVHGSRLVFCNNPLCFATWVAENKL